MRKVMQKNYSHEIHEKGAFLACLHRSCTLCILNHGDSIDGYREKKSKTTNI